MGNYFTTSLKNKSLLFNTAKRKIQDIDDVDYEALLHVSKRRRLLSTSEYIYKTLFEEGCESDITVCALGKQWHLHKVYLYQSPYFRSMFSGNWKEANDSYVNIEVLDDTITEEAFEVALGSFYKDDLDVEAVQVIPLLATAVLLQMDSLIDQCISIMKETINIKTVLSYHEASRRYGVCDVDNACKEWLLHNLLTQVLEHPGTLRQISPELMCELISSPNLYVIQTEFTLYVLLRAWIFLRLHPEWEGSHESAFTEAHRFFQNVKDTNSLLGDKKGEFEKVFSSLRINSLIFHFSDIDILQSDNIIPWEWLQAACTKQWYSMLLVKQEKDKGPIDLSEEVFNANCSRCGRVLLNAAQHIWRWTGYNFELDLIMTHENTCLKLKRNHRTEQASNAGQTLRRHVMYRVTISSLNEQRQVTYTKSTGMQSISLARNEETKIMTLEPDIKYPLYLSANFLVTTPTNYPFLKDSVRTHAEEEPNVVGDMVSVSL